MEEQSVLHFLSLSLFVYFSSHFYSSLVFFVENFKSEGQIRGNCDMRGIGVHE